jgi:hypothetical protein
LGHIRFALAGDHQAIDHSRKLVQSLCMDSHHRAVFLWAQAVSIEELITAPVE